MTNKSTPKPVIRIIKKSTCPKLSPIAKGKAKGELTCHIGHDETAKSYTLV